MLRKAKKYAKKIRAKFIFTGEVLGERPMSQHKSALMLIEKESGLSEKLLRPLSAKLLPITEAERKWVDRAKLLDIQGRKRDRQTNLANQFKIRDYPTPAGGCLLTNKEYAEKLKDLLLNKKKISLNDIRLLKIGRHFRFGKSKIIVGRNVIENKELLSLKDDADYLFEVPNIGSPTTILQGTKSKEAVELAASLTARYSDSKENKTLVKYGKNNLLKSITASKIENEKINKLRIIFSS